MPREPQRAAVAIALALAACGGDSADHELSDTGLLCAWSLSDSGAVGSSPFEVGRPVRFDFHYEVTTVECPADLVARCDVDRGGTTITFSTAVSWNDPPADAECPRTTKIVDVECETGALAAGTYTLHHGASTATLVMPSSDTGICLQPSARTR